MSPLLMVGPSFSWIGLALDRLSELHMPFSPLRLTVMPDLVLPVAIEGPYPPEMDISRMIQPSISQVSARLARIDLVLMSDTGAHTPVVSVAARKEMMAILVYMLTTVMGFERSSALI